MALDHRRRVTLIVAGLLFALTGGTLILLNRLLLRDSLPKPSLLLWVQTAVGALFAHIVTSWSGHVSERPPHAACLVVAVCTVSSLYLGNRAYIELSVGEIQILKCTTPVFLGLLGGGTSRGLRWWIPVLGLCVGAGLTVFDGSGALDGGSFGVMLQLGAGFSEALKLTASQRLMRGYRAPTPLGAMLWVAPWMLGSLTFLVLLELGPADLWNAASQVWTRQAGVFCLSLVLSILLSVLAWQLLQAIGGLTLKFITIARNVALVGLSALVLGEPLSFQKVLGAFLCYVCLAVHLGAPKLLMAAARVDNANGSTGISRQDGGSSAVLKEEP